MGRAACRGGSPSLTHLCSHGAVTVHPYGRLGATSLGASRGRALGRWQGNPWGSWLMSSGIGQPPVAAIGPAQPIGRRDHGLGPLPHPHSHSAGQVAVRHPLESLPGPGDLAAVLVHICPLTTSPSLRAHAVRSSTPTHARHPCQPPLLLPLLLWFFLLPHPRDPLEAAVRTCCHLAPSRGSSRHIPACFLCVCQPSLPGPGAWSPAHRRGSWHCPLLHSQFPWAVPHRCLQRFWGLSEQTRP